MKTGQSMVDIAAELERQFKTRKDYVAKQGALSMEPAAKQVTPESHRVTPVLQGLNGTNIPLTSWAHGQVASSLGIPKPYYDRMIEKAPTLLCDNVNEWLRRDPEKRRMVRTLDGNVRAVLSDRYRPLDSFDLLSSALPALQKVEAQIVSSQVTETRLYIKAIFPQLCDEIPEGMKLGVGHNALRKGTVIASVTISNSEVGAGSLRVEPGCYKTECTNLMIFGQSAMRKYHVGRSAVAELDSAVELFSDETRKQDDKAFWMKVKDVIASSCSEEAFRAQVLKMKDAADDLIVTDNIPAVIEVTRKKLGLAEGLQNPMLKHLIEGQDLSRWGVVNAITRTAEDQADYDIATDLERAGGKVLELHPSQWKYISEAA